MQLFRGIHKRIININLTRSVSNKSLRKKEQREQIVNQHASKNPRRTDRVYAWGHASTGALGVRKFIDPDLSKHEQPRKHQLIPRRLSYFDEHRLKPVAVAAGYGFSVCLCKSSVGHEAYGCGINTDSQLGLQIDPKSNKPLLYVSEFRKLSLPLVYPNDTHLTHVACGRAHTVVCTDREGIFTFGNNAYGQCGRSILEQEIYSANAQVNKLSLDEQVKKVVCGQDHTLIVTESGKVYGCGLNADGQAGQGHFENVSRLTPIGGDLEGENIIDIASRGDCILAVSDKGHVFGWGNSEYSQLASVSASTTQQPIPRHLPLVDVGHVTAVAVGGSICALLNDVGEVYVWGYGILGQGPRVLESLRPVLLPPALFGSNEFNANTGVASIHSGLNYFAAITRLGDLYTWGQNRNATLGLGNILNQFFPFRVQVAAQVLQVACGVDHMLTLARGHV